MDAEVYPEAKVANLVSANFVPVKIHIKDQQPTFDRFGVQWTPTLLLLDPEGVERHRVEGYLPVDDFIAEIELGQAKMQFQRGAFAEAQKRFRLVCEEHPSAGAAAEACYWAGVSAYKASGDAQQLKTTAEQLRASWAASEWARKASVWL